MRMSKENSTMLFYRGYKIPVQRDFLAKNLKNAIEICREELHLGINPYTYVAESYLKSALDISIAKPALTGGSQIGIGLIDKTIVFQNYGSYLQDYKGKKYYR